KYKISRSTLYRLIKNDPNFPWQNVGEKKKFILSDIQIKHWLANRSIKQEIIKFPSHTVVIRRFIHGKK
ncbi:MAG: hypothetical protein ACLGHN_15945, partial [Bacteriovoracia bacterium]